MSYTIGLLTHDGELGDYIYTFYPSFESAKLEGLEALKEHQIARDNGVNDSMFGWAFGFEIFDEMDKSAYKFNGGINAHV